MSLAPSTCPGRSRRGAHPVVVVMDVLMNDGSLAGTVLRFVGGTQVVRSPFGVWQFSGILAAMGSFRVTGGSSFREIMRRAPRLWTNGRRIATCFVDSDRDEVAVAFFSSKLAGLDERISFSKKGGGGVWVFPLAVSTAVTANLGCCCCAVSRNDF